MYYFYDNSDRKFFEHCIIPDPMNSENLYQMTKDARLKKEVTTWLDENIGANNWLLDHTGVILEFNSKEDAMAFKLMWS